MLRARKCVRGSVAVRVYFLRDAHSAGYAGSGSLGCQNMQLRGAFRWGAVSTFFLCPVIALAVDTDGDGVDDVIDVCCNTPGGIAVDALGRPIGDFDSDCDVDTLDFAEFQINVTGPMESGCCHDSDCYDNDPCTIDSCTVGTGECVFTESEGCGECTLGPECAVELSCDVPLEASIDDPDETDSMCFCAIEGELVRLSVLRVPGSSSSFNPNWRLVDSLGNPTVSCGAFSTSAARVCGPLPGLGSPYHLEVIDGSSNGTGNYRVHMQRYSNGRACDVTALECEAPVIVSIEHPLDTDLLSFAVENADMVRISVAPLPGSGPAFNASWRLLDAAGNASRTCGRTSFLSGQDCGPLPAAGSPYRIEIEDGARDDVGSVEVRLERTLSHRFCAPQAIDCDEPIFSAIETNSDGQTYPFRAIEGDVVRVSVVKLAGGGPAFTPSWRVIDATGNGFGGCGTFASTSRNLCGPFPAAGNPYAIQVTDGSLNDTGPYAVHFHRLTASRACDQTQLTCGVPHVDTLRSVVDTNLHAFTAPEQETVRVALSIVTPGPHFDLEWRLIDAAGNPAPSCGSFTTSALLDCPDLPAYRSPYRVEVQDVFRDGTGDYDVRVDFLTSGCP